MQQKELETYMRRKSSGAESGESGAESEIDSEKRRIELVERIETQARRDKNRKTSDISNASTSTKIMTCLRLKKTPFKAKAIDLYRNPYYRKQHRKKSKLVRFYYNQLLVHPYSYLLAFILVTIAVVFGSLNIVQYFSIDTSICDNDLDQLVYYLEYFKEYSNYSEAMATYNATEAVFLSRFMDANDTYSEDNFANEGIGNMSWPRPYEMSQEEITAATKCTQRIKVCWDEDLAGWICKRKKVPCPIDYPSDMFFAANSTWDTFNATLGSVDLASETAGYLTKILERVNMISSVYCFYLALLIFIGPPYNITKGNFVNTVQGLLGMVSKSHFIITVLILWYALDALIYFLGILIAKTDIFVIIKYMTIDPCFVETEFLFELYNGAVGICENMTIAENQHSLTLANIDYLYGVENTYYTTMFCKDRDCDDWTLSSGSERIYDESALVEEEYNLYWDYNNWNCPLTDFMRILAPKVTNDEATFDFVTLFISSGAIGALLLQPILANWMINFFIVCLDPLCNVNGRILLPLGDATDFETTPKKELRDNIKTFIRYNTMGSFIFSTILLALVGVNLYTSSVM